MDKIDSVVAERLASLPGELPTDAEIRAEEEKREQAARAAKCLGVLRRDLGRFAECRVNNYHVEFQPQAAVVARLVEVAAQIQDGEIPQLCWHGTVGTGKDHLASAMLSLCAKLGHSARWVEARTFCQQMAGAYQNDSSQEKVIREWASPRVLCLSDAIALDAKANHKEYVAQLIRARYNAGKATWLTINVRSLDQAEKALGEDVWSRLAENQIALACHWNDYRSGGSE